MAIGCTLKAATVIGKITTNVDQVLDVFYVTELDGRKSERSAEIRGALLEALRDGGDAAATAPP